MLKETPKFRAWLKNENKMVDVIAISLDRKFIYFEGEFEEDSILKTLPFEDIELMQGLTVFDEIIYEEDIVHIQGGEQMFGYYEFDKILKIKNLEDIFSLYNLCCGINVIGNKYETPELWEEKNENN